MQEELRRIHREVGGTFVFVTHDQGEALALASRIAVMNEGRIEQTGPPEDIYFRPANRFVATFIGEANLLAGAWAGGTVGLAAGLRFADAGPEGAVMAPSRPAVAASPAAVPSGGPASPGQRGQRHATQSRGVEAAGGFRGAAPPGQQGPAPRDGRAEH